MMTLYDYFRSSASYRVRIALNYKQLAYEKQEVHLVKEGGEQHRDEYVALNPQHLVPTLVYGDVTLGQSLAILEYLEETHPDPSILPAAPVERAYVRQLSQIIACDCHPLDNLRVLQYLKVELDASDEQKDAWYHHWIHRAFDAFEALLSQRELSGLCCFGDTPTIADMCLVPQVYNARRFEVDLSAYPRIAAIEQYCLRLDCFKDAAP